MQSRSSARLSCHVALAIVAAIFSSGSRGADIETKVAQQLPETESVQKPPEQKPPLQLSPPQEVPSQQPPVPSRIQVALKGSAAQIKQACDYLTPRLREMHVEYIDGCSKLKNGRAVFIFDRDDSPRFRHALNLYLDTVVKELEKSGSQSKAYSTKSAPNAYSVTYSALPCLKKVVCQGSERWWPCACY